MKYSHENSRVNSITHSMVLFPHQLCKLCIWQGGMKKF